MPNIPYTIIIYPITQILEFSFLFAQKLFKESGISIIFIGLTISVLCLPMYAIAEKWQKLERDTQNAIKPKTDKIKKVFNGDEQYMILSAYYRQIHYHPVYALRSSFGLLIQIPFFIAAYSYLSKLEAIKNVSFSLINDLGSPDKLLSFNGFSINLLPLLMTLINCISGVIYTKGFPIKDKIQLYGIAVIFLILLYNSPSALVLYWTINNIFSVFKNIYYKIQLKNKMHLLLLLFSIACLIIAAYCFIKLRYKANSQNLIGICFFAAVVPWIFIIFRKQLSVIFNFNYEKNNSLIIFLLSIFLIFCLLGLFIPSQLISFSPQEFSFIDNYTNPNIFILNTALQVFGLFVFWPVCLYFLFFGNVRKYFSLFFLAISLTIIVNIFLFPGNYGLISINLIYSRSPVNTRGQILFNICIMLFVFAASYMFYLIKNKKIMNTCLSLCIFSVLCISFFNIYKINSSFIDLKTYYIKEQDEIEKISPLFSLSRNSKNIVIIMLDRAISVFIPLIFEESPELKEIYSGFTYFPNTVSFNGYTSIGTPPLFGGYEYTPEEINKRIDIPLVEKHNQALKLLPHILNENGFYVFVTDSPYADYNQKGNLNIFNDYPGINAYITDSLYTNLYITEQDLKLPKTGDIIKRNMFWYSLFKGMPLLFRRTIYMGGDWCSNIPNNGLRLTLDGYSVLYFLPRLTKITNENTNYALIITNNTTHEGSLLQAPDYTPSLNITNYGRSRFSKDAAYHVNAASIKRLSEWFIFLKNENVYNNTRIILVSDHGPENNFITKTSLPFNLEQFNPLLMVKDFNASGELETDMTFMSNADVPYLALLDVIDKPVNPFTGNEISIKAKEKPLYIAISGSIHVQDRQASQFTLIPSKDYYVHSDIFKQENWENVK